MAYEPTVWADGEAGGTPITADALNKLEQGLADVELTPGPKGDQGEQGPKGDKGDQGDQGPAGADGADGLGFTPAAVAAIAALTSESTAADIVAALQAE